MELFYLDISFNYNKLDLLSNLLSYKSILNLKKNNLYFNEKIKDKNNLLFKYRKLINIKNKEMIKFNSILFKANIKKNKIRSLNTIKKEIKINSIITKFLIKR